VTVAGSRSPVVVDTGVFAAGLTARTLPLAERYRPLLVGHELVITVQTISELYFGAAKDNWGVERLRQLDRRIALAVIAPCDDHLARICTELRLQCLRAGHPLAQKIHANDLWVATVAVQYAISLVSDDRVFVDAPGLQLSTARQ
jgi:predicted nucleic acid-binding protein